MWTDEKEFIEQIKHMFDYVDEATLPNSYKYKVKHDKGNAINKKIRKSNKKRIQHTFNKDEIEKYINDYIESNPKVLYEYLNKHFNEKIFQEYIKKYINENISIDFVKHIANSDYYNSSDRYTLGLYNGNKLISESKLGLHI